MDYKGPIPNNSQTSGETKSKNTNVIFLVVLLVVIIVSLFLGTSYKKQGTSLSEKEKMTILDELIKNSDANKYTYEEKLDILKKLSETGKTDKEITEEKKLEILNSITK
ncbi:MAG: hypothetical protein Athens071416_275 [Parcubacteria group bacterium Athens0714_16]|nr:MAG: hypothetical protein Athens071416_275 [Parcubacteria group bacterium Athens0714_16]